MVDAGGQARRVRSCRLVSLEHRHLVAITYEVCCSTTPAPVVISLAVVNRAGHAARDEQRRDRAGGSAARRRSCRSGAERRGRRGRRATALLLGYQTANSGMTLGVGVDHVIETAAPYADDDARSTATAARSCVTVDAQPGRADPHHEVRRVPVVAIGAAARSSSSAARRTLDRASRGGFDDLRAEQRAHLDRFWDRADVRVDAPGRRPAHASRRSAGTSSSSPRRRGGPRARASRRRVSPAGYEGHYFWDTEIYVLPFLSYTQPRIARNLLRFRHSMLPRRARGRASSSQRGAMFPWRTINGEEASAYFQAGTAQYHINADIAYAIRRYVDVRGDVGLPRRGRRRDAGRDRAPVGGPRVLRRRRPVPHPRGHRARRVHDRRQRQHVHEPHGAAEPALRGGGGPAAARPSARTPTRRSSHERRAASPRRSRRGSARRPRCTCPTTRRAASTRRTPVPRPRGLGPRRTPPEQFPLLLHYHPLVSTATR